MRSKQIIGRMLLSRIIVAFQKKWLDCVYGLWIEEILHHLGWLKYVETL